MLIRSSKKMYESFSKIYQLLKREGSEPLEGEKAFISILLVFYLRRKKEKDCGVGKVMSRAR
jgi:hypothetical protein